MLVSALRMQWQMLMEMPFQLINNEIFFYSSGFSHFKWSYKHKPKHINAKCTILIVFDISALKT